MWAVLHAGCIGSAPNSDFMLLFVMVLDRWGARVCRGLPDMQLLADIAIPRW